MNMPARRHKTFVRFPSFLRGNVFITISFRVMNEGRTTSSYNAFFSFFIRILYFPSEASYSYFTTDFRLKIFL